MAKQIAIADPFADIPTVEEAQAQEPAIDPFADIPTIEQTRSTSGDVKRETEFRQEQVKQTPLASPDYYKAMQLEAEGAKQIREAGKTFFGTMKKGFEAKPEEPLYNYYKKAGDILEQQAQSLSGKQINQWGLNKIYGKEPGATSALEALATPEEYSKSGLTFGFHNIDVTPERLQTAIAKLRQKQQEQLPAQQAFEAEQQKFKQSELGKLQEKHPIATAAGGLVTPEFIASFKAPGAEGFPVPALGKAGKAIQAATTGAKEFGLWESLLGGSAQEIEQAMGMGLGVGTVFSALPIVWKGIESPAKTFLQKRALSERLIDNGFTKQTASQVSDQYFKGNINKYELGREIYRKKHGTEPTVSRETMEAIPPKEVSEPILEAGKARELLKPYGVAPEKIKGQFEVIKPNGERALGSYEEGAIKLASLVKDTTGTHESFHYFVDKFADTTLYNKAAKEAAERIGQRTPDEIEEYLADQFARYRLNKRGISGRIKGFFDNLVEKIKGAFGGQSEIKKLFKEFEAGKGIQRELVSRPKFESFDESAKSEYIDKLRKWLDKRVDDEMGTMQNEFKGAKIEKVQIKPGVFRTTGFPQWAKDAGFSTSEDVLKAFDPKSPKYNDLLKAAKERLERGYNIIERDFKDQVPGDEAWLETRKELQELAPDTLAKLENEKFKIAEIKPEAKPEVKPGAKPTEKPAVRIIETVKVEKQFPRTMKEYREAAQEVIKRGKRIPAEIADVLGIEQKPLARKVSKEYEMKKFIADVERITGKEISPTQYKRIIQEKTGVKPIEKQVTLTERQGLKGQLKAEAKASKEGFKYGRKTKLQEMREAIATRKERADAIKFLRKHRTSQLPEDLPIDAVEKIDKELEGVAFEQIGPQSKLMLENLKKFIEREKAAGRPTDAIPQKLIKRLEQKPISDMTTEELKGLGERIKKIADEGRLKAKLKKEQLARYIEKAANEIKTTITSTKENAGKNLLRTFGEHEIKTNNPIVRSIKGLQNFKSKRIIETSNPRTLLQMIDAGKEGNTYKAFWETLKEGERVKLDFYDKYFIPYVKEMNRIKPKDFYKYKDYKGYSANGNEKLAILRAAEDPDTLYLLLKNNKIKPEQIQAMKNSLSSIEKDMMNLNRSFYKDIGKELSGKYRQVENANLGQIENYHPREFIPGQGYASSDPVDFLLEQSGFKMPTMEKGMTKTRVKFHDRRFLFDLDGATERHIDKVSRYMGYADKSSQMKGLLNKVKTELTDNYGKEVTNYLERWINDTMFGAKRPSTGVEKFFAETRLASYGSALGGNPSVLLNQIASLPNGANEIGWDWTIKGLNYVIKNPKKAIAEMDKSIFMKGRSLDPALEKAESLKLAGRPFKRSTETIVRTIMSPISAMDRFIAAALYHGGWFKELARNPKATTEQLMKAAEKPVEISQTMTQPIYRSPVQRENELGKQLFMFTTQPLQAWNKYQLSRVQLKNGLIKLPEHIRTVMNVIVIPSALVAVFGRLSLDKDTPADTVGNIAGLIPYVGQIADAIQYGNDGFVLKGQKPVEYFVRTGVSATQAAKAYADEDDEKFIEKATKTVTDGLETILSTKGLSLRPAKIFYEGVKDISEGTDTRWQRLFKSKYRLGKQEEGSGYKIPDPMASLQRKIKALSK